MKGRENFEVGGHFMMNNKFSNCKKVYLVLIISILILLFTGCSANDIDDTTILGAWEYYGIVENSETGYGEEAYSMEHALVGNALIEEYGLDSLPETVFTVTKEGVKELYADIPGSDLESVEMISDRQMKQRIKITMIGEEKLNNPLYADIQFTLVDGYLFVKTIYSDNEFSGGNVNIFKRK